MMKVSPLKTLAVLLSAATLSLSVSANTLRLGVISGPEFEVAEVAQEQAKKLFDLDVELVAFNDYVIPNQALNDGDIDLNAFQHKPYLDLQIQERDYDLVSVAKTFVFPIAAYANPKKIVPVTDQTDTSHGVVVTSLKGEKFFIAEGSAIAIPNDPTNLGRSLLLLQAQGLIKLDPKTGLLPTQFDIIDNPYNYKIVELEAPMLPRALDDDTIDLAIINNAFAGQIDLTPSENGIFVEDKDSPYVNFIVAREENQNNPDVLNFIKAYQTDPVAEKANEVFHGGAVKGW